MYIKRRIEKSAAFVFKKMIVCYGEGRKGVKKDGWVRRGIEEMKKIAVSRKKGEK